MNRRTLLVKPYIARLDPISPDSTYRLTKATYPWANFEQFSYDIAGNRKTLTDKDGTTIYGYDDANRLLNEVRGTTNVAYTWDNAGNMLTKNDLSGTTTYEWNYDSRLVRTTDQGQGTTDYAYDPFGIRVRLTAGGTTKRFLYSNEDIIAEYGGAADMYYVHGPLIDEPLAQFAGTTLSYMHRDGPGSVTAFSNTGGQLAGSNAYTSFGTVHEASGVSSRYGYTSRELDASGMMYYRSRYYQPELGRFLNQDYYQGNELVPPSLHRFAYANGNPIINIDSWGYLAEDVDHVNNWLRENYPDLTLDDVFVEYTNGKFWPFSDNKDPIYWGYAISSIRFVNISTGILLLWNGFIQDNLDEYMRWRLANTIIHEKLHIVVANTIARAAPTIILHDYLIAAFDIRKGGEGSIGKLHEAIETLADKISAEYCNYANSQNIPCKPEY